MRNPRTSNTAKAKRSRAPHPHLSDELTFIVNPRRRAAASNGGQRAQPAITPWTAARARSCRLNTWPSSPSIQPTATW
jgi:hypothetical protein